MLACPTESTVLAFASGTAALTRASRRSIEAHLSECAECRVLFSELARQESFVRTRSDLAFARTQAAQAGATAEPPVRPGEVLDGKYEIEWTIAAGGMGVVVAAWHRLLGQRVAIKFPLAALLEHTQGRARLLREAQACARLKSEHVVRLLDVGELSGPSRAPYVVMEHLVGRTLAERLAEDGPLPVADAVDTIVQACEGVEEAHASGIIHRDLKPSNLFESRRFDGSRVVKVLDFGIAKALADERLGAAQSSLTGSDIMGSVGYMAPEQVRSTKDVDARADIWSLAVTLRELLTGQLWPKDDQRAVIQPEGLARLIDQCLELEPDKRVPSARELARRLAGYGGPSAQAVMARMSLAPAPAAAAAEAVAPRAGTNRRAAVGLAVAIVALGLAAIAFVVPRRERSGPEPAAALTAATMAPASPTSPAVPSATPASAGADRVAAEAVSAPSAPAISSASSASSSSPPVLAPVVLTRHSAARPSPSSSAASAPLSSAPSTSPSSPTDPHGLFDRK
jgi:serine/threonine-protein kinase